MNKFMIDSKTGTLSGLFLSCINGVSLFCSLQTLTLLNRDNANIPSLPCALFHLKPTHCSTPVGHNPWSTLLQNQYFSCSLAMLWRQQQTRSVWACYVLPERHQEKHLTRAKEGCISLAQVPAGRRRLHQDRLESQQLKSRQAGKAQVSTLLVHMAWSGLAITKGNQRQQQRKIHLLATGPKPQATTGFGWKAVGWCQQQLLNFQRSAQQGLLVLTSGCSGVWLDGEEGVI